jgi:hypothetical protein
MWLDKKTPNGRWRYGYGQWNRPLKEYVKLPDLGSIGNALRDWLISKMGLDDFASVPTFYIWGVDPNGQKRMGGKWTVAHGGSQAMLKYFNSQFEPCMLAQPSDQYRVACLEQSQLAPGAPSLNKAVALAQNDIKVAAVQKAGDQAAAGAAAATTAILVPVAILGLLILLAK